MHKSAKFSALLLQLCFVLESSAASTETNKYHGRRDLPQPTAITYSVGFGNNSGTPSLQLSISSAESFPVSYQVETLRGYNIEGIVLPFSTTNVIVPNGFELSSFNDMDKGIAITTENGIISVHGINYEFYTTDGFLALPCDRLNVDSYEYYALTYHANGLGNSGFLIVVGCEDSTVIDYGSNTAVLNKMETLYLENTIDYSGTRVLSNKPISFFSGHTCTVFSTVEQECDHLVEQIPPTVLWGTHFMTASFFGRSYGELYRILAANNSTLVTVNCNTFSQPQTFTLISAGSWTEFSVDGNSICSIESSGPLLVMVFSRFKRGADPFMMMIPSVDQYTNDYVFHSPVEFSNYITILVTPQYYHPHQILVDGVSQESADWDPVHCANGFNVCGYYAYVTLEPGDHHVWHSHPCARMSVLMYGFEYKNSYGQPAGILYGMTQILTAPSNFSHTVLEGDPHSVRFTWSPPPEQEQSGEITHYTINCTSESSGDAVVLNRMELEAIVSAFAPATFYWCFISASTVCEGEGPYSDAIHLLTIPDSVKNLTVMFSDAELRILWADLNAVVTHYIVTLYQGVNALLQFSVSERKITVSREELGEHEIIEICVSAVNSAGIGPPTVVIYEQSIQSDSGDNCTPISTIIGIAGAAASLLLILVVVEFIIILKIKGKGCCWPRRHPSTYPNTAYGHNIIAINRVLPTSENVAHDHRARMLNRAQQHKYDYISPNTPLELPHALPEYHEVTAPRDTAESSTDKDVSGITMRL